MTEYSYLKVVKNQNYRLYSLFAEGMCKMEYPIKEWVETPPELLAEGYGICVYKIKLFHVPIFIAWADLQKNNNLEIWECEVDKEMPLPVFRLECEIMPYIDTKEEYASTLNEMRFSMQGWPDNTCMFKRIKLRYKLL